MIILPEVPCKPLCWLFIAGLLLLTGCGNQEAPVLTAIQPSATSNKTADETQDSEVNWGQIVPKGMEVIPGSTYTRLADGRIVRIDGIPDKNKPHFNLRNQVVLLNTKDDFEIYCYSEAEFPPLAVHSATLVNQEIYIIGFLNGPTPTKSSAALNVYRLDPETMKIKMIPTKGSRPFDPARLHARYQREQHTIRVYSSRSTIHIKNQFIEVAEDFSEYELDLTTFAWRKLK